MRTILVVDDDPVSARLLEMVVRRDGYAAVSVASAEAALARLDQGPFVELIIMDQNLGGMTGLELFAALRADVRFRRLPAILCTGFADGETVRSAMSLGIRHFIVKPIRPNVVTAKVAAVQAERPAVVEAKASRMARLQLTDSEYKTFVRATQEHLVALRSELEHAEKDGDKVTSIALAQRFREPANLLGAGRVVAAVDHIEETHSWRDFEHAIGAVLEEVAQLEAILYDEIRPRLISKPLGNAGLDVYETPGRLLE